MGFIAFYALRWTKIKQETKTFNRLSLRINQINKEIAKDCVKEKLFQVVVIKNRKNCNSRPRCCCLWCVSCCCILCACCCYIKCMSIIIKYFLNHGRSKCALPTLISWKFRYIPLMLCILRYKLVFFTVKLWMLLKWLITNKVKLQRINGGLSWACFARISRYAPATKYKVSPIRMDKMTRWTLLLTFPANVMLLSKWTENHILVHIFAHLLCSIPIKCLFKFLVYI